MYAFFARISDPRYGGTYMTLFNTISLLGWVCPNTLALNMVDILTFRNCSSSNSVQRNCSTLDLQKVCCSLITNNLHVNLMKIIVSS